MPEQSGPRVMLRVDQADLALMIAGWLRHRGEGTERAEPIDPALVDAAAYRLTDVIVRRAIDVVEAEHART